MFHNTFEHGYSDAVNGRQRVLGSEEYRSGYQRGARYRRSEKAIELGALAIIAFGLAIVFLAWVLDRIQVPV